MADVRDIRDYIDIRTKNKPELEAYRFLESMGGRVLKRGWPDFAVLDPRTCKLLGVVEVKPTAAQELRPQQMDLFVALTDAGVPYWRYDPEAGFRKLG